jgi:hypothetical protein
LANAAERACRDFAVLRYDRRARSFSCPLEELDVAAALRDILKARRDQAASNFSVAQMLERCRHARGLS